MWNGVFFVVWISIAEWRQTFPLPSNINIHTAFCLEFRLQWLSWYPVFAVFGKFGNSGSFPISSGRLVYALQCILSSFRGQSARQMSIFPLHGIQFIQLKGALSNPTFLFVTTFLLETFLKQINVNHSLYAICQHLKIFRLPGSWIFVGEDLQNYCVITILTDTC